MTKRIKNSLRTVLVIMLFSSAFNAQAQDWKTDKKFNIVFGLTQPLVAKGFNVEANYIYNRLIFDYSHGVSLDFSESTVSNDLKKQGLAVHMPYTTGFGVGYRLKKWLNIRVEPKWHKFEFYYNGETQSAANKITSFNTMSLGIGLYGHFQPFKNSTTFLKGIMVAPSIRYWPTLSSTLSNDTYTYLNKQTLATEEITALDPGFGFTPFIFNISIGYSFNLKKINQ
jgi:hypothetical protein